MPNPHRQRNRQRRNDRGFRPMCASSGLESRLLLSTGVTPLAAGGTARAAAVNLRAGNASARAASHARRTSPVAEINSQYSQFQADFATVGQYYVESLLNASTSTITVTANLTAPYAPLSTQMVVDNAAVFGPEGVFTTPVVAVASQSGVPLGASYVLTGRIGNTLIVDTSTSSSAALPSGTTLSAQVQSTSQTSAAAIFPAYIMNRTQQLAINLVNYFNSLPLRLPYFNAPPHTANQRGAIQKYVYSQIAGFGLTTPSLQESLLLIPLPTTPGADLQIYTRTVASAVEQSRQAVLGGVSQIYAGRLKIAIPAPNNPLGTLSNTSTGGSSGSSSSTSNT